MPEPSAIERVVAVMRRLRDPQQGCPWDRAQDFRSLVPHTLEEAYEVVDAIERGDYDGLKDELGDLLFQVVFYTRLAEEQERFCFEDVCLALEEKLRRRHPHVFGPRLPDNAPVAPWEAIKAAERRRQGRGGILDDIPRNLPALSRARKLGKRAAGIGFDWVDAAGALDKVREEVDELAAEMQSPAASPRLEEELGDLLFAVVQVGRLLGVDAETALRRAGDKFERRFRHMEAELAEEGIPPGRLGASALEALWHRAKAGDKDDDPD